MSTDPMLPEHLGRRPHPPVSTGLPGGRMSRLARNTALSLIAILALGSTRLIFNVMVGHNSSKSVLGHVNTQLSVAMFAALLVSAGTGSAATKFLPAALGRGDPLTARASLRVLGQWCMVGTLATVVGVVAVMPIALPRTNAVDAAWTAALLVAYAAYSFVKGAMYGYDDVRRYTMLELASDALTLAVAGGVVLAGAESILVAPFVVGYGAFAILGWIRLTRVSRQPGSGRPPLNRAEMRGFVLATSLGTLASSGFLQLSMVFAQRYGTAAQAGDYASAFTLTLPAYFIPRALSLALFPAMASAFGRGDSDALRHQLAAASRLLVLGMLPLFAAAIFLAEPLLVLFFGARFATADLVLELLLVATYVSIAPIAAVNSLTAAERRLVRVPAAASLIGCVLGVGLWLAFGSNWGITGVAFGYLMGSVVQSAVPFATAMRRYHVSCTGMLARATVLIVVAGSLRAGLPAAERVVGSSALVALLASVLFGVITVVVCPAEMRALAVAIRRQFG